MSSDCIYIVFQRCNLAIIYTEECNLRTHLAYMALVKLTTTDYFNIKNTKAYVHHLFFTLIQRRNISLEIQFIVL